MIQDDHHYPVGERCETDGNTHTNKKINPAFQ